MEIKFAGDSRLVLLVSKEGQQKHLLPWSKCTVHVLTLKKMKTTLQNKSSQVKTNQTKFIHALCRGEALEKDKRYHVTVIAKITHFIVLNSKPK